VHLELLYPGELTFQMVQFLGGTSKTHTQSCQIRLPYAERYFTPRHVREKPSDTLKLMTIAAGLRCRDGVVLCADSEIVSDGAKSYEAKLFCINWREECY